jgi:hypothetical protein
MTRKVEHEHLPLGISPSKRVDGWQPHAVVEGQPMEQDQRWAVVGTALQEAAEPAVPKARPWAAGGAG